MKRFPWFEIILIVVVGVISLYGAFADGQNFSRRWFTRDDAYYYFKVAQNISEGHGSTFDGMNKTNGYHPLWMLICIPIFALARFDLILPLRILFLVMSGLSLATAILLYRLIGKVFVPAIGALAALYWALSPGILQQVYQQGLETGIAAFFVVLFVYKLYDFERSWHEKPVTKKDLVILGILAIGVMLSRLDLLFFVAIVGIWVIFRGSAIRYLLPLDIVSFAFSVLLAFIIKFPINDYYRFVEEAIKMIAVGFVLKIPLAYVFGLYQRGKVTRLFLLIRSLILFAITSSILFMIAMLVVARVFAFENFPRMLLVYDAISTFVLLLLTRLILIGLKTSDKSDSISTSVSPLTYLSNHWTRWFQEGMILYGIAFGGLGIYMVWNKISFGTFSPVSGQIKRWWGSLSGNVYGGSAHTPLSFFGLSYQGDSNAWVPVSTLLGKWAESWRGTYLLDVWRYVIIVTLFALFFYLSLLINRNKAKTAIAQLCVIPLFCASWLQIFYYHGQAYAAYREWYWITQLILVVIGLSIIIGMSYQFIRRVPFAHAITWVVAAIFGMYLGASYWSDIRTNMTHHEWSARDPYMDMAAFLEQNTEPGSVIGMTGGGNVGYFIQDRTIINMDGLINSNGYFELLQNKEAGKYLADQGMNYVMANLGILDGLPYRGQYNDFIERQDLQFGGKNLVRYRSTIQP
jgi:hypothetical protein